MNLSFLLLMGALISGISFVISLIIVRKVFDEEYRRPWFFITLSVLIYAPAQLLRYLEIGNYLQIPNLLSIIYSLEFIAQGLLMYGLLLEFFILRYVKGKFVKMRFIPVQEGSLDGMLSIDVSKSQTYFSYKKDRDYLTNAFSEAVKKGYQGFLITQQSPFDIRKRYSLPKTPILKISNPDTSITNTIIDSNSQSVDALHFNEIIRDIDNFYDQAKNPFILIELDEILRYNPFEIVLELIQYLKSKNERFNGILITSINEDVTAYSNILRFKEVCNMLD